MNFLFWLFFIGILVASLQDVKRKEVDNWLNLFLSVAGFSYLFFVSFYAANASPLHFFLVAVLLSGFLFVMFYAPREPKQISSRSSFREFSFSLIYVLSSLVLFFVLFLLFGGSSSSPMILYAYALTLLFALAYLFNGVNIFAGGDAKLLFALTALFVAPSFTSTLTNIGVFLLFLMISGSIYGLFYSLALYSKHFKKINQKMSGKKGSFWVAYVAGVGVMLGGVISHNYLFFLPGALIFVFPLLYVFAKGLEEVLMLKSLSGEQLREGDWLVHDVSVGSRVIRANFSGLSKADLVLLRTKKKVLIKEGIPFVPAFLIAFLSYTFLRTSLTVFFLNLG